MTLSFLEHDYTLAIVASPLFSTHSLPALWVIHPLGVSKDDHTFEHTKLSKGSPIQLINIDLAHHSFGYNTYVYLEPSNPSLGVSPGK